jgi:hypothetical protein
VAVNKILKQNNKGTKLGVENHEATCLIQSKMRDKKKSQTSMCVFKYLPVWKKGGR